MTAVAELFVQRSHFDVSAETLFRWHALPAALEQLTPPWEPVKLIQPAPGNQEWRSRNFASPRWPVSRALGFRASRLRGRAAIPGRANLRSFKRWEHAHRFIPDGANACWLEDRIEYELPLGWLGQVFGGWLVRRKLEKLFQYRHRLTAEAMAGAHSNP
jgi:uncharacterized protein